LEILSRKQENAEKLILNGINTKRYTVKIYKTLEKRGSRTNSTRTKKIFPTVIFVAQNYIFGVYENEIKRKSLLV